MITEDYCSYEVSKLLKEKGFDWEVKAYHQYDSETKEWNFEESDIWDTMSDYGDYYLPAPTHQMALKFLRKKYGIIITIDYDEDEDTDDEDRYGFVIHFKTLMRVDLHTYPTFEEATENALLHVLNNIDKIKNLI